MDQEGGYARRDVGAHGIEQQPELPGAQDDAVEHEPAPGDLRALDEEREGQRAREEAQRREQERRQLRGPGLDDDEVGAPDGDDQEREADVEGAEVPVQAGSLRRDWLGEGDALSQRGGSARSP